MPTIQPDFTEVKSAVEPGTYAARLTAIEERTGKNSGTPYLNAQWELIGEGVAGMKVFDNLFYQGKGAFTFQNVWKATMGEEIPAGTAIDTDVLLGKEATLTLKKGDRGYLEVAGVAPAAH